MANMYEPPESDLTGNSQISPTYATLGFWRKLFVVVNWIGISLIFINFLLMSYSPSLPIDATSIVLIMLLVIIFSILLAHTYWVHVSVVKRNVKHLYVLSIIQLIPFLNPIGFAILWSIRSASKKELQG